MGELVPVAIDGERIDQATAARLLGVSKSTIARRALRGEISEQTDERGRAWYSRDEIEALVPDPPRDSAAVVVHEAVALLRQSHQHNEAAMGLLLTAAQKFGEMSTRIVQHLIERNEKLEQTVTSQRDLISDAERHQADDAIRVMQAEDDIESRRALRRSMESVIPVVASRITGTVSSEDAALAQTVRSLVQNDDLVSRMRQGLTPDECVAMDMMIGTARKNPGKTEMTHGTHDSSGT